MMMNKQHWTINCQKHVQKSWDVQQSNYSWLTCSASAKKPQMWIWIPKKLWSSHQETGKRRFWTGPSPRTGDQGRTWALGSLETVPEHQTHCPEPHCATSQPQPHKRLSLAYRTEMSLFLIHRVCIRLKEAESYPEQCKSQTASAVRSCGCCVPPDSFPQGHSPGLFKGNNLLFQNKLGFQKASN